MEKYDYKRGNNVLAEGSHASLLCSNSLQESLNVWITEFQPVGLTYSLGFFSSEQRYGFKELLGAHLLRLSWVQRVVWGSLRQIPFCAFKKLHLRYY